MLNNDYNYKIFLRNKFYKKTINKINNINKSLELLNKYNKDINAQIGGTLEQDIENLQKQTGLTRQTILEKKKAAAAGKPLNITQLITKEIDKINTFITLQKKKSIEQLNAVNEKNRKLLDNIQNLSKFKLDEQYITQLIDNIKELAEPNSVQIMFSPRPADESSVSGASKPASVASPGVFQRQVRGALNVASGDVAPGDVEVRLNTPPQSVSTPPQLVSPPQVISAPAPAAASAAASAKLPPIVAKGLGKKS